MEQKITTIDFTIKPLSYEVINSQFTKCRCYILATGDNANYSDITLEAVKRAIPSLYNTPVVAHVIKKEDGTGYYIGGHDSELKITDQGMELKDLTVPYGLVPESCNAKIVEVLESDGITKNNYLIADILLWTGRYNIMDAKYSDDVYFNQSCEIIINNGSYKNDKYFEITDFTFSGLCLLGKDKSENSKYNTRPCFPSARVEKVKAYSLENDNFKTELSALRQEVKNLDLINNKYRKKEAEYSPMIDKLIEKLAQYKFKNQYGEDAYQYSYIDHNKEMISVVDRKNNFNVCGFKYSVTDDVIDIDFENKFDRSLATRDKLDVGDIFNLNTEIQTVVSSTLNYSESVTVKKITKELEDMTAKYGRANKKINDLDGKLSVYEREKNEAQERALKIERNKVFEKYNLKLANNPEYIVFKTGAAKLSPEDIEKECLLIAGRQMISGTNKFSFSSDDYEPSVSRVAKDTTDFGETTSRYGNLMNF